ncbi:MAG: transketolase [Candidatus Anammoxibacter sp.]
MEKIQSNQVEINRLEDIAKRIRVHIVKMLAEAGSGHPGGSLSATDLMVALYFCKLNHDSQKPKWEDRDRFILSKGHACPALYAVLAESGYFDIGELMSLRKFGSILQGHPDMKRVPGIDISSGSLGQGLSIGLGMSLSSRIDKKNNRIYVMLGDGEIQEGQIWEAAMAASHYKVDNLCAILDNNGFQIDGSIESIMSPYPITDKWRAFGWHVIEIDGHNMNEILNAYDMAKTVKEKPSIIIAKTIKGKGVGLMEADPSSWHGVAPSKEQANEAIAKLN